MPTPPHQLAYRILYLIFRFLVSLLCRFETQLPSNLPSRGPLVIATNHLHLADPCLVMLGLRYAYITILAGEKWAESWPVSWLLKTVGGIFVNRGEVDRVALAKCLAVLRDGGILGLAPEGTRSRTGVLQRGKPGVAYIAIKAGVPILPVGISGQEKLLASWKRLRRPHIMMRVGEPFWLDPIEGRQKGQQLQARSDEVMCRIAALVREDLRGVYADAIRRAESTA
jgi:1-acyl-sn-glycerol-3-phosphate acyltransferase